MSENNTKNEETESQEAAGAPETDETPTMGETHTESVETPENDADGVSGDAEDDDTPAALKKARKEAAERRVTAREATERAEALQVELDTARADLDRFKQGMARDIVQRGMSVTFDAFTAAGHTLEDLTDEDGSPDAQKIRALDEQLGEKYGRTRSGNFGGVSAVEAARALADRYTNPFTGPTAGGSTWGDVLKK